jgi:hypothetical protein
VAVLFAAGCLDRFTHSQRDPGSVLWVSLDSVPVERTDLQRLQAAGLSELFVPAAVLEWSGSQPSLAATPAPSLPPRSLATLVVEGEWARADLPAVETGRALAERLRSLKIEAESRGLLPRGFHLHLQAGGRLRPYGEVLAALRRELERELFLSVTLDPGWLDDEAVAEVVDAVDFLVSFLYGSRPGASDDDDRWDLERIEETARRLDALGRGFLVGAITRGSLARIGGDGEVLETAASADLRSLLEAQSLEAKQAFLFEGFHRQVLDFEARRPVRVGEWTLRRKDRLRLNRPTVYHLAELRKRLSEIELPHYLGVAYDGLPGREKNLALDLESLLLSRSDETLSPDISLGVDLQGQRGDRWVVLVSLRNRGALGTSLALLDANYLEVHAPGAVLAPVELGEFRRLELARGRQGFGTIRGVRNPDSVRLFYPLLDGGWSVTSGPIFLTAERPEIELDLRASFLLPGGRTFEATRRWRPGDADEEGGEGSAAGAP